MMSTFLRTLLKSPKVVLPPLRTLTANCLDCKHLEVRGHLCLLGSRWQDFASIGPQ